MPRSSSHPETEVKLRLPSAVAGRRLLRRFGFKVQIRRVFESNILFDTPDFGLRRINNLLRLRLAGRRYLLTFKGTLLAGRYKSREEIESDVADPVAVTKILAGLGYKPAFRYEKYRTVYRKPRRSGLVALDETPFGDFLEIEAAPRSIDRIARELGFSPDDYITAGYGALYLEHCRSIGALPGDMVFTGRR
jgi:adenylate cyclase class 2